MRGIACRRAGNQPHPSTCAPAVYAYLSRKRAKTDPTRTHSRAHHSKLCKPADSPQSARVLVWARGAARARRGAVRGAHLCAVGGATARPRGGVVRRISPRRERQFSPTCAPGHGRSLSALGRAAQRAAGTERAGCAARCDAAAAIYRRHMPPHISHHSALLLRPHYCFKTYSHRRYGRQRQRLLQKHRAARERRGFQSGRESARCAGARGRSPTGVGVRSVARSRAEKGRRRARLAVRAQWLRSRQAPRPPAAIQAVLVAASAKGATTAYVLHGRNRGPRAQGRWSAPQGVPRHRV